MHRLKTKLLEGPHAHNVDKIGNFARHLLKRFIDDRCFESAGSLSYTSILAVVPFAAVVFAVLAAFPIFDQWTQNLVDFMFDNFVPSVADNLEQSLRTFTDSARTLPATGLMALLFSVGLTMWSVEKAFNRIWRVPMVKPKLLRFLTYWGLLTAGSLCVVSLLALNSALSVYINLADYTPGYLDGVGLMLAPVLIEFIGFSAAYWLIPHRSVSLRYALTGGVIATILFELLKWLFAIYLQSVSFRHIYGAMAVVPITLVWLYAVWLVVLFGASLTASLASFRYRPKAVRAAKGLDFYWVLRLVVRFQQARTQRTRLTFNSLSLLEPNIAEPMIRSYLAGLAGIGLIESDSHEHWWLSGPLSEHTLKDLHQGLGLRIPVEDIDLPSQGDDIDGLILPVIDELRGSVKARLERPLSLCFPEAPAP
jgi:membrane protein